MGAIFLDSTLRPVVDAQGNIYGTASLIGGPRSSVVWRLGPPVAPATEWSYRAIAVFKADKRSSADDPRPYVNQLAVDQAGTVYASTSFSYLSGRMQGGSIYSLTPSGGGYAVATVHDFTSGAEDWNATAFQVLSGTDIIGVGDSTGAFTPTPITAFSLHLENGAWQYRRIYRGGEPTCGYAHSPPCGLVGPLVVDHSRNMIVTASTGGEFGAGEVFELAAPAAGQTDWTARPLYDFRLKDGPFPRAGVVADRRTGALFGTSLLGANSPAADGSVGKGGATFRLDPPAAGAGPWSVTFLHNFRTQRVYGGVVLGHRRLLYGATAGSSRGDLYLQTPD